MLLKDTPIFKEINIEKTNQEFPDINIDKLKTSSNKKIYWICPNCGNIYKTSVYHRCIDFTSCPKCKYKPIFPGFNDLKTFCVKNNRQDILEDFDYEKNYPEIPENIFIRSIKKYWFKCNNCGNYYQEYLYNKIKHNSTCKKCNPNTFSRNTNRRLSFEEIRKRIEDKTNGEYSLLSKPEEYQNQESKLLVRHNCEKCGKYEYRVNIINFDKGKRCPKCFSRHPKRDLAYVKNYINNNTNFEYISGNFENSKSIITVKCRSCGNIQRLQWNHIQQGQKCKYCEKSGFNNVCAEILNNLDLKENIDYFREVKFQNCKDEKELPFDFQIFSKNKNYFVLLEIQGKQHYDKSSKYNDEKIILHDNIKKSYCKQKSIKLYEIMVIRKSKKYLEILKNKILEILGNLGYNLEVKI